MALIFNTSSDEPRINVFYVWIEGKGGPTIESLLIGVCVLLIRVVDVQGGGKYAVEMVFDIFFPIEQKERFEIDFSFWAKR